MTALLDLADAISFMDSAAVMLGRGEMPAPGTEYAAKWYLAHEALISQAREAERMRGALGRIATVDMGGGFLGALACRQVAITALDAIINPATGGSASPAEAGLGGHAAKVLASQGRPE